MTQGRSGAFVATLAGYQAKTVEQKLRALRSFLRFASEERLAAPAMADAVPAVPSRKQARIPRYCSCALKPLFPAYGPKPRSLLPGT